MEKIHLKAKISDQRSLSINSLPFNPGELVEITIQACDEIKQLRSRYSLRGKPFRYTDPFESVAEDEWEILK